MVVKLPSKKRRNGRARSRGITRKEMPSVDQISLSVIILVASSIKLKTKKVEGCVWWSTASADLMGVVTLMVSCWVTSRTTCVMRAVVVEYVEGLLMSMSKGMARNLAVRVSSHSLICVALMLLSGVVGYEMWMAGKGPWVYIGLPLPLASVVEATTGMWIYATAIRERRREWGLSVTSFCSLFVVLFFGGSTA